MFNKVKRGKNVKIEKNCEGFDAYALDADKALFMMALDFKPTNSYYRNVEDKLKHFQDIIRKNDIDFVISCANYLGKDMGRRLSPTIMLTDIATLRSDINVDQQNLIQKAILNFFTRPDFLAHAAGYFKFLTSEKSFRGIPLYFKNAMRTALEKMSDHTLVSQKMRRREIKLKDLIKVLKPVPSTEDMSKLYKDIIEDGKLSKCKVIVKKDGSIESDKITTVLTAAGKKDSKITKEQVKTLLSEKIETWPINEFIRNLSNFSDSDSDRIYKRIKSILASGALRIINPFDLLFMKSSGYCSIDCYDSSISETIIDAVDKALDEEFHFNFECQRPLIMFDVSGSMFGESMALGLKYLSLLKGVFEKNYECYAFNDDLYDIKKIIECSKSLPPNRFAQEIGKFFSRFGGGTRLFDSLNKALMAGNKFDGLVLITDEQNHNENFELEQYKNILTKHGLNGKTLVINVSQTETSAFKPNADLFRLFGQEAKIIELSKIIFDWKNFKNSMMMSLQNS